MIPDSPFKEATTLANLLLQVIAGPSSERAAPPPRPWQLPFACVPPTRLSTQQGWNSVLFAA